MKLSNQQIEAVVDVIAKQQREVNDKDFKKKYADELAKNKKKIQELITAYEVIPVELKKLMRGYTDINKDSITNMCVKHIQQKQVDKNKIKNDIILASIDAESLEELKSKLKISF